jgi:hypothetical protein
MPVQAIQQFRELKIRDQLLVLMGRRKAANQSQKPATAALWCLHSW